MCSFVKLAISKVQKNEKAISTYESTSQQESVLLKEAGSETTGLQI